MIRSYQSLLKRMCTFTKPSAPLQELASSCQEFDNCSAQLGIKFVALLHLVISLTFWNQLALLTSLAAYGWECASALLQHSSPSSFAQPTRSSSLDVCSGRVTTNSLRGASTQVLEALKSIPAMALRWKTVACGTSPTSLHAPFKTSLQLSVEKCLSHKNVFFEGTKSGLVLTLPIHEVNNLELSTENAKKDTCRRSIVMMCNWWRAACVSSAVS